MKPKLLLHACCAGCLIGALTHLEKDYDITVFFYNPNIHPRKEYELRKQEAIKYCELKKLDFIEGDYDVDKWLERIMKVKDHALQPEGGKRCSECYRLRLEKTALAASEKGIGFFATTLTLGPNKKADVINSIGREIAQNSNEEKGDKEKSSREKDALVFVEGDFKKKNAYNISVSETKRLGIYRQHYCGCIYSMRNEK